MYVGLKLLRRYVSGVGRSLKVGGGGGQGQTMMVMKDLLII